MRKNNHLVRSRAAHRRPVGKMAVRRIRPAEAAILTDLEERCFDAERLSQRQIAYHIANPRAVMLGAFDERSGDLAGYILLFFRRDGYARVYSVAVDAPFRGCGVGERLLKAALDAAARRRPRPRRIGLEVRASNSRAMDLYEKNGFKKTRVIRAYYEDGEDAIKMIREGRA